MGMIKNYTSVYFIIIFIQTAILAQTSLNKLRNDIEKEISSISGFELIIANMSVMPTYDVLQKSKYDSDSTIDSLEIIRADGTKEKQIYFFNYSKNTFSELYKRWDNNNWVNDWIHIYKYDSNGKIINRFSNTWNVERWDSSWRYIYEYDDRENLLSETFEYWSQDHWKFSKRTLNTYNSDGQKINRLDELWIGSEWVGKWRAQYGYNEYGNRNFWLTQNYSLGIWVDEHRTNATFDRNGNMLLYQIEISPGPNQWINESRNISKYNDKGNIITWSYDKWDLGEWKNKNYSEYTYSDNSKLVQLLTGYFADGIFVNDFNTLYSYDANGLNEMELVQHWDSTQWLDVLRTTYTYDTNGNLISQLVESYNANQWILSRRIQYTYNNNRLIEVNHEYMKDSNWCPTDGFITLTDSSNRKFYIIGAKIHIYYSTNTSAIENSSIINTFTLSQNYPNPFNPITNIKYSIASKEFTTIKVYDILGKEVAILVNELKDPGHYNTQFDATKLSSGIYIYSLHFGKYLISKKMLLLK